MAIGAYASVLSLMRAVDNVLLPSRSWLLLPDKTPIETLQQKLSILQDSLQLHCSRTSKAAALDQDSEIIGQIHKVVNEADEFFNNYVVNRLRGEGIELDQSSGKSLYSSFCFDTDLLISKFDSVNQKLLTMGKEYPERAKVPRNTLRPSSHSTGKNSTMVGFEDHLVKIMDLLTRNEPNLEIFPIVGMGGIGKTTLARNVFENKCMVEHFDLRIWLTISQEYDVKEAILGLEGDRILGDDDPDKDLDALHLILHQKLFSARYLIVVDDVWSIDVWNDFKRFFPNQRKRSRLVATTRLSDVAHALSPHNSYPLELLNEEKSLKLFNNRAFSNGGWSSELEEIGKKIARKCGGLPLALVIIGGLLANSDMSCEYWEFVADDMNSFANSQIDEDVLSVLSLSYIHLPVHLKPCFLYMGVFPEGSSIRTSKVVESWVAEGIVKPGRDRNLEEAAMEFLEDLVSRNLILIRKQGSFGNIKTCRVHDLLRQLCIRESRKESLFRFPKTQRVSSPSLVEDVGREKLAPQTIIKSRYLEIEDAEIESTLEFASPLFAISLLWNLQVLYYSPSEWDDCQLLSKIWEMPQLRHVKVFDQVFPDQVDTENSTVLHDLQTLKTIDNFRCTEEVVRRIPNLKKLGLYYDELEEGETQLNCSYYCLDNLALFQKLESLSVSCIVPYFDIKPVALPCSLKKLALDCTGILWKDMSVIGSLPNLQVLKLKSYGFRGDEWCTVEGQFLQLKHLKMDDLDLVTWRITETSHFPVLETLVLVEMRSLENIPLCMGDIETLRMIRVGYCKRGVV